MDRVKALLYFPYSRQRRMPGGIRIAKRSGVALGQSNRSRSREAYELATILVVDDESQARTQLGAFLGNELGHDILYALDGDDAIDVYAQVRPDLVITDLVMPGLHGLLLIDHLTTFYPGSRIIAMSGKEPEKLEKALALGAAATLRKPIQRGLLVASVERLLAIGSSSIILDGALPLTEAAACLAPRG